MMVHLNRFNHQTKIRLGDLFMCFILNNLDLEIDIYALVNHEPQFMTHHLLDFVVSGCLGLMDLLSMSESDVIPSYDINSFTLPTRSCFKKLG